MKFRDAVKTVYFIHIPRTAGSYIEDQLCKKFKINKKWPDVNEDNLFGLKKISSNQYLTLQHYE